MSLAESTQRSIGKTAMDTLGVGEALAGYSGMPRAEGPVLREAPELGFLRADDVVLGDSLDTALGTSRYDTIGVLEAIVNTVSDDSRDGASLLEAAEVGVFRGSTDIVLAKSASPDPVLLGEELTYTLAIHNIGPSDGPNTTLTDTLPASVDLVSSSPSQGICTGPGTGTSTITCAIGNLSSGDSAIVTIIVIPRATGDLVNTASVVSGSAERNPADNTVTVSTTAIPAADLSLAKADSPDPVLLGQQLTYTLTLSNAGPSIGSRVTFTDPLPGGVTLVSSSASQGTCAGTSTITCTIGDLASGDSATVTIVVIPP